MARAKKQKICKVCGETNQSKFYASAYGRCKKCHSLHINKNNTKSEPKPWSSFDLTFDLCYSQQLREMYYR